MSATLEVSAVFRRKRVLTHHGRPSIESWMYYAEMKTFKSIYVPTWPISRELFEALVKSGVQQGRDR